MPNDPTPAGFPDPTSIATLRAWYAGMKSRAAVEQYRPATLGDGRSARDVLGHIRRQFAEFARSRHRDDLVALFQCDASARTRHIKAVVHALEVMRSAPVPCRGSAIQSMSGHRPVLSRRYAGTTSSR